MNGRTGQKQRQPAGSVSGKGTVELVHRLAETARDRIVARAEADGKTLDRLRPLVAEAVASGGTLPLWDTGAWIRCSLYLGRLRCQLWRMRCSRSSGIPAPDPAEDSHVRLTVTAAKGEAPALLEVSRAGLVAMPRSVLADQAASEAPNLERCVAWAWLAGADR